MNTREIILDAFAPLKCPEGRLTTHHCEECDRVDLALRGRSWQDVANDFPSYCHDSFPLLTAEAQRYFLPAYLLTAIGQDANCQGISIETALEDGRLAPETFTPNQRAAIAAWIVDYWREFASESPPGEILQAWTSPPADL
jgi:hypothetical protein